MKGPPKRVLGVAGVPPPLPVGSPDPVIRAPWGLRKARPASHRWLIE